LNQPKGHKKGVVFSRRKSIKVIKKGRERGREKSPSEKEHGKSKDRSNRLNKKNWTTSTKEIKCTRTQRKKN